MSTSPTGGRARSPDAVLALLTVMTVVSGIADAASFLDLGHVFVANSTGNVVFLGFAAAGAHGLSVSASLIALAGFLVGALTGGRLATHGRTDQAHWLRRTIAIEFTLVAIATVLAIAIGHAGDDRFTLIALLAIALGLQNATARALAVPDMTTTVMTLTLTGLAADSRWAGGDNPRWRRRTGAVLLMLGGAFVGALLVLHVGLPAALGAMLALLAAARLAYGLLSETRGGGVPPAGRP
jgi:uncharacterized membrane protein YoaK (UPF0700 family)